MSEIRESQLEDENLEDLKKDLVETEGFMESYKGHSIREQMEEIARNSDSAETYVAENGVVVIDGSELEDLSSRWADEYGEEFVDRWMDREEFDESDRKFLETEMLPHVASEYAKKFEGDYFLVLDDEQRRENTRKGASRLTKGLVAAGLMLPPAIIAMGGDTGVTCDDRHADHTAQPVDAQVDWADLQKDIRKSETRMAGELQEAVKEARTGKTPDSLDHLEELNTDPQLRDLLGKREMITLQDVSDNDMDGLIYAKEKQISTDPADSDTDGDGLLDGWEVYGIQRGGFRPLDLSDHADPLEKDLFVQIVGDENLDQETKQELVQEYAKAPMNGISLHLDTGVNIAGENPSVKQFYCSETSIDPDSRNVFDPVGSAQYGTFHFMALEEVPDRGIHTKLLGFGERPGDVTQVDADITDNSELFQEVFMHEIGHNILGKIDPEHRFSDTEKGMYHSKYGGSNGERHVMYPVADSQDPADTYHPGVWSQIENEGVEGLPDLKPDNWIISYSDS
ncbi:MAG: hypothetical protein ABEK01_05585 [Candidatus Nanohaloarchaea archaeon]